MPVRPLHPELVRRMRKIVAKYGVKNPERLYFHLGKMKLADYRLLEKNDDRTDSLKPGRSVRKGDVHRTFPEEMQVVIKRVHGLDQKHPPTAADVKKIIENAVKNHNILYADKEKDYSLRAPIVHDIGLDLLAMAHTNAPNIIEVIGDFNGKGKTERGKRMLAQLKKSGIDEEKLKMAANRLNNRTATHRRNVFLFGTIKGKIDFMLMPDLV